MKGYPPADGSIDDGERDAGEGRLARSAFLHHTHHALDDGKDEVGGADGRDLVQDWTQSRPALAHISQVTQRDPR